MVSTPRASCQLDYTYEIVGADSDKQSRLASGFSGWDPPTFEYSNDHDFVGRHMIVVTATTLNGEQSSFMFELHIKTPCDLNSFVSIEPETMDAIYVYIVTDKSADDPFVIDFPSRSVITTPFQHDWCGDIITEVFFQLN